jgi:cytochrome P450
MNPLMKLRPRKNDDLDFGAELSSPALLVDPDPVFHKTRLEDPVHYSRSLGAWLLTRYDDFLRGLRDPRLSSDRVPRVDRRVGEPPCALRRRPTNGT